MKTFSLLFAVIQVMVFQAFSQAPSKGVLKAPQVKIADGMLEGRIEASGVRSFKGIPFAQPPLAELRWKDPQPVKKWTGILKADHFGPNAMQKPVFGDMNFRSAGMSEDCLYLNVWTPAKSGKEKLPVLVYFYGGGYVAGDGSEARYDGEAISKKGIVALTVNYRLGVFGFMAHPELSKESAHQSSGNYALLDQHAALKWVKANIAAFGGDPDKITIAGESAGSISVSAQMASPLSKGLIAGAIGESGAMIKPTLAPISLAEAEKNGTAFTATANVKTLAELRAIPAATLLDLAAKPGAFQTAATVDGYFLPKLPAEIFAAGEQAKVPLLAGWNSAEVPYQVVMGMDALTPENYHHKVKQLYGEQAEEALKLYPGNTAAQVLKSATDLSSDRFIVYSTWKWMDLQHKTGGQPVYGYIFGKTKPEMTEEMKNSVPGLAGGFTKGKEAKPESQAPVSEGAPHAFEIEYAMGNLATNKVYAWKAEDFKVSELMLEYFANFVKTGNPNGKGLPAWDAIREKEASYMHINVSSGQQKEQHRDRYLFLDKEYNK
ncbi:carboxylesterase/lipase family protein [Pedobacter sp. AW31-3R]|uniref:carboxylesterase/lipase family protein n=1 Tax=Pedobacter sp. AW31-3R TaxID=3445781 RepID=UPI003FA184F6